MTSLYVQPLLLLGTTSQKLLQSRLLFLETPILNCLFSRCNFIVFYAKFIIRSYIEWNNLSSWAHIHCLFKESNRPCCLKLFQSLLCSLKYYEEIPQSSTYVSYLYFQFSSPFIALTMQFCLFFCSFFSFISFFFRIFISFTLVADFAISQSPFVCISLRSLCYMAKHYAEGLPRVVLFNWNNYTRSYTYMVLDKTVFASLSFNIIIIIFPSANWIDCFFCLAFPVLNDKKGLCIVLLSFLHASKFG